MRIGQKLSISVTLITIGNLIDCVYNKSPFIDYIGYVIIFIPIIIILLLIKKEPTNKIVSIILLILSCIGIWFGGESNLVSATLISIALYIIKKNKRIIYIYLVCIIISIIARFTFTEINVSQFFVQMAGASFILILHHHYIHKYTKPKTDNTNQVICPNLDSITIDILQKLYLGYSVKEVSSMIYLTEDAVSKRIGRARVSMDAKSTYHLLGICRELGYLNLKLDNR